MTAEDQILHSWHLLQTYVENEHYRGFDPYDGLTSPLFNLPILKTNHKLRFLSQQLIKRSPLNLRPLLRIEKGENPVTLGLAIQAYAESGKSVDHHENISKINKLIIKLRNHIPSGYECACWGYDFPWEARYAAIPAYQPTIVATGIISNSLYLAWKNLQIEEAKELVISSCHFAVNHLNRFEEPDGSFCFSYSPFDHEKVFNASMKGARLLAQGYSLTGNTLWKNLSAKSVQYVMKHQRTDGAWIYSQREAGGWIDNYHTGYILDCLDEYIKCTGDQTYNESLQKGFEFYLQNFIKEDGQPKFYDQNEWPVDCTAAGQTLLTLIRFNSLEKAKIVALWMIQHMQSQKGYFYFRKYSNHLEKTSFMRWSNAWMLAGLSTLVAMINKPLPTA